MSRTTHPLSGLMTRIVAVACLSLALVGCKKKEEADQGPQEHASSEPDTESAGGAPGQETSKNPDTSKPRENSPASDSTNGDDEEPTDFSEEDYIARTSHLPGCQSCIDEGEDEFCLECCESGGGFACNSLAYRYDRNSEEEREFLKKGCEYDYADSCAFLAIALELEENQNWPLIFGYGEKACRLGWSSSCADLGEELLELGEKERAREFLDIGCKLGDRIACGLLQLEYP